MRLPGGPLRWTAAGAAAAGCVLGGLALATSAAPGHGRSRASWVAAWGLPVNPTMARRRFSGQTIRTVLRTDFGGSRVRVRFSNLEGAQPLSIADARVAVSSQGAALQPGTSIPLRFGGKQAVSIPAGQSRFSDAATLRVTPFEYLAVSLYVPGQAGPGTGDTELASYYVAPGDHAADTGGSTFGHAAPGGYFVTGLDVFAPNDGLIVAFGDSITVGRPNQGRGWPFWLAQRLVDAAAHGGPRLSVIDMGISGNDVLPSRTDGGASAEGRLQRDVLDQTGLREVLMMEGINDIGRSRSEQTASALDAGLGGIVQRVRATGARILLSPLTPAGDLVSPTPYGGNYSTPSGVQARLTVSSWIRTQSGAYNKGFDFERVIADRNLPDQIAPAYDSGDHLHPSLKGQLVMGSSIDIGLVEQLARAAAPLPAVQEILQPAAPVVGSLTVTPSQFSYPRTGLQPKPAAGRQPRSLSPVTGPQARPILAYSLNEKANVIFVVMGNLRGVRNHGRCVPSAKGVPKGLPCMREAALVVFRRNARTGTNRIDLLPAVGRRRLTPGAYLIRAVPFVGALEGTPRGVSFHVVNVQRKKALARTKLKRKAVRRGRP